MSAGHTRAASVPPPFLNVTRRDALSIWWVRLVPHVMENLIWGERLLNSSAITSWIVSRANILNFKLPGAVLNADNEVNVRLGESFSI